MTLYLLNLEQLNILTSAIISSNLYSKIWNAFKINKSWCTWMLNINNIYTYIKTYLKSLLNILHYFYSQYWFGFLLFDFILIEIFKMQPARSGLLHYFLWNFEEKKLINCLYHKNMLTVLFEFSHTKPLHSAFPIVCGCITFPNIYLLGHAVQRSVPYVVCIAYNLLYKNRPNYPLLWSFY